jgi:L-ascorbate metabolism protein UlaG (beta-lactamase superfamily)
LDRHVLRITWLGHSTVLIEVDGVRVITDPVFRRRVAHLRRTDRAPDPAALGDLEAALVSHLHHDHLDLSSLAAIGRETHVVVPQGGEALLRRRGFSRITPVTAGARVAFGAVEVGATYAEHDGRTPLRGRSDAVGYVLSGSASVYFAGDTDLFPAMSGLAESLDVALLPIAGWGPRLPPGHLDPERAAKALALLRPRVAIPIHWGTYRRIGLTRSPSVLRLPADLFVDLAHEFAPEVDVRVLAIGGCVEIPTHVAEPV